TAAACGAAFVTGTSDLARAIPGSAGNVRRSDGRCGQMADNSGQPQSKLWLDVLTEKQERLSYAPADSAIFDVPLGSRTVRVLVPRWRADVDIFAAVPIGRLVAILGAWRNEWAQQVEADGVMMLAWPLDDGSYAVGVWHELLFRAEDRLRPFLP